MRKTQSGSEAVCTGVGLGAGAWWLGLGGISSLQDHCCSPTTWDHILASGSVVSAEGWTLLQDGKANWPRKCIQRSALYKKLQQIRRLKDSEQSCGISEHLNYDELITGEKRKMNHLQQAIRLATKKAGGRWRLWNRITRVSFCPQNRYCIRRERESVKLVTFCLIWSTALLAMRQRANSDLILFF